MSSDQAAEARAVTPYGFIWGNVEVERMTRLPDGSRVQRTIERYAA